MRLGRCCLALTTLLAALLVVSSGCGGGKEKDKGKPKVDQPSSTGGEKGDLYATPNDDYHVRLLIHPEDKKAVARVLDESAKEEVAIDTESISVVVTGEKGEPIVLKSRAEKGKKSSLFEGTNDRFGQKIDRKKVEITATIGGKNYVFSYDEHGHK